MGRRTENAKILTHRDIPGESGYLAELVQSDERRLRLLGLSTDEFLQHLGEQLPGWRWRGEEQMGEGRWQMRSGRRRPTRSYFSGESKRKERFE